MTVTTLLPPQRTETEVALEAATARIGAGAVPVDLLWRPETCPADLLPWLGWALSVDTWDPGWSEEAKRRSIVEAIPIHRVKGTRASVVRALRAAGYGDAILIESWAATHHDGAVMHDGSVDYVGADDWAEYRVVLARPITIRQAAQVRELLAATAPARCHLNRLDFVEVAHLHDARIAYDGVYAHGAS